jgi:hypothetical protein
MSLVAFVHVTAMARHDAVMGDPGPVDSAGAGTVETAQIEALSDVSWHSEAGVW